MAGQFGTQTETMRQAAAHVADVNQQIQGRLTALRNQLAPLESTWRGDASLAFQQLMIRWNEDATRINRSLHAIGEAVGSSGADYQAVEQDNSAQISSIRQALG
jgi:WXG100 family type VII secretion target